MQRDIRGLELSGATARAVDHYETAVAELQCYRGDPVAHADAALTEAPDFVMAHALRAWLHLLGTEPGGVLVARAALDAAAALPASTRERGHLAAIRHLSDGRWHAASRVMEDVTMVAPRDALGLLAGHQIDFFTGHSRMLRDRIARAMPHWDVSMPGFHSVLGMQAFGLEETGDYTRAEAAGRHGIDLEPTDGWSQHAVAHVLEMQNRTEEGIAWMRGNDGWTGDSFFQVHNWWHLALYHLELGDIDAALSLFDDQIHGSGSGVVLDMVDASALLWQLHLRGVDLGGRWDAVAGRWAPIAATGHYAFNDFHAVMAFTGSCFNRVRPGCWQLEENRTMTPTLTTPRIASADASDRADALAIIVEAFRDDPACRTFWPDLAMYRHAFPRFAELYSGPAQVDRTSDGSGAAFWLAPGFGADPDPLMAHLKETLPADRKAALFAGFAAQGALHPEEPHWYLPFIGVRAEARGRGLGAALLAHGLARADEDGKPAYLEATSRLSVPLYRRFGFETIGIVESPGYPEITGMRRPARAPSGERRTGGAVGLSSTDRRTRQFSQSDNQPN